MESAPLAGLPGCVQFPQLRPFDISMFIWLTWRDAGRHVFRHLSCPTTNETRECTRRRGAATERGGGRRPAANGGSDGESGSPEQCHRPAASRSTAGTGLPFTPSWGLESFPVVTRTIMGDISIAYIMGDIGNRASVTALSEKET